MKVDKYSFDRQYDIVNILYSDKTTASIAFYFDKCDNIMHWYEYKGVCIEKIVKDILSEKFKFKTLSRHDNSKSFRNAQRVATKKYESVKDKN